MLALCAAVSSVMASLPVPPISVSTLLTEPVLARLARVSVLVLVPRSTPVLSLSAVDKVTLSVPEPPMTDVVIADRQRVGEVAECQRVGAVPRLTLTLLTAAPRVTDRCRRRTR